MGATTFANVQPLLHGYFYPRLEAFPKFKTLSSKL